jgi:hypothetical protein
LESALKKNNNFSALAGASPVALSRTLAKDFGLDLEVSMLSAYPKEVVLAPK